MLVQEEEVLCQAISLNLHNCDQSLTKLSPGDILEIHCDGYISVQRKNKRLDFGLCFENQEENKVYYMGCNLETQMVGMVKLLSALMGLKLIVLEAERRQCKFLVTSRD